jgi:hypothetical protein
VSLSWTLRGLSLFLAAVNSCQSTEYSLPATRCDDYCAAMQRLHCPDDDPAACVASCERYAPPWFSPRPGPCDGEEQAWLDCHRNLPESASFCLGGVGTWTQPNVCEPERQAAQRCLSPPVIRAFYEVCDAWNRACGTSEGGLPSPDGGPPATLFCMRVVFQEEICRDEQLSLYGCLLQNPPECDHPLPASRACSRELDVLHACDPDFKALCNNFSIACAFSDGFEDGPQFWEAQARYYTDCLGLGPPITPADVCQPERDAYNSCWAFEHPGVCDVSQLRDLCAVARAALDACAAAPGDAGTR